MNRLKEELAVDHEMSLMITSNRLGYYASSAKAFNGLVVLDF